MFRAACGKWIVLGVATDKQFDSLADVLGFDNVQREKYATNEIRLQNVDDLMLDINIALKEKGLNLSKISKEFPKLGIPFSEINSVKTLLERPDVSSFADQMVTTVPKDS